MNSMSNTRRSLTMDKKIAFISFYLAEKEFFLPDKLREALHTISYLITCKGVDKALAIHRVNKKWKKDHEVEYTKEFLWKKYNSRLAHIKHANEKYHDWVKEMKERNYGVKPKLCECGCGQEVKKGNRFLNGHNAKCRSKEDNEKLAEQMRQAKEIDKSPIIIQFKRKS